MTLLNPLTFRQPMQLQVTPEERAFCVPSQGPILHNLPLNDNLSVFMLVRIITGNYFDYHFGNTLF